MNTETKLLTLELKNEGDASEGDFVATFAKFGVIDLDEDVTLPAAFKSGTPVLVGPYGHDPGQLPVGKGEIVTDDEAARIVGAFNLNTTAGRDTYEAIKDAGDLMEWSYLYRPSKVSFGEHDGRAVRFLEEVEVFSVDPVLKGAGIDTGTDAIKSRPEPKPFTDHVESVISDIDGLTDRIVARAAMRAKDGRRISADGHNLAAQLVAQLVDAKERLEDALADPPAPPDLQHELMLFERTLARANGVAA